MSDAKGSTAAERGAGPAGRLRWQNLLFRQSGFLIAFILVLGLVITLLNPNFINPQNIINILGQISVVGIVSVGMGIVLITGEFDISVGSQLSLLGAVMAILLTRSSGTLVTVLAVAALGGILGLVNGLLVTKSRCASFIITLGTMTAYHGFVLVVTQGRNIPIGSLFTMLGRSKLAVIPTPIIVFILVLVLAAVVFRFTRVGRTLFAVGGNREAAYLSGINVDAYKIGAYVVCGLLCALAALVLISKLGASYPNTGDGYELAALASIVVGGVSLWGGKGTAPGIFLGVVVFGVLSNALNMVNVSPYFRDVFTGTIIIIASILSRLGESRA
jgi:ribose transport system permease protein